MNRTYYKIHFGDSVAAWEFGTFKAAKSALENIHWSDPSKSKNNVRIIEHKLVIEEKVVYGKEDSRGW